MSYVTDIIEEFICYKEGLGSCLECDYYYENEMGIPDCLKRNIKYYLIYKADKGNKDGQI